MVEKIIWDFLKAQGATDAGAAGLMGNLFAESGLISNNLQNTYNTKLGMTDEEYTRVVDDGTYTNFVYDSAGYGIAQWTYWSRKADLKKYAGMVGKSIGDLETQLGFLWEELTQVFPSVKEKICTSESVLEASNSVLMDFEQPADMSEAAQVKRAAFGTGYYEQYRATGEQIAEESTSVDSATKEVRYNTAEECPSWAYDTIFDLVDSGFLYGNGVELDLSLDMIRVLKVVENMVKGEIVDA